MEILTTVRYAWTGRDIKLTLGPNQFAIEKRRLEDLEVSDEYLALDPRYQLSAPDHHYKVYTGLWFNKRFADKVIDIARKATLGIGAKDDLDDIGDLDPSHLRAHVLRLAHGIEHLAGVDLRKRGIISKPQNKSDKLVFAETYHYTEGNHEGVAFMFGGDLDPQEVEISVNNAAQKARNLIR